MSLNSGVQKHGQVRLDWMHTRGVDPVGGRQVLANKYNKAHKLVEGILAQVFKFDGGHVSKTSEN